MDRYSMDQTHQHVWRMENGEWEPDPGEVECTGIGTGATADTTLVTTTLGNACFNVL